MMGLMLTTSEILNLLKYLMMGLTVMRARTKISVLRLFGATLERTVCGSRHRFPIWSSQAKQWRSREERLLIMIRRPRGTTVTAKMVILTTTTVILLVGGKCWDVFHRWFCSAFSFSFTNIYCPRWGIPGAVAFNEKKSLLPELCNWCR